MPKTVCRSLRLTGVVSASGGAGCESMLAQPLALDDRMRFEADCSGLHVVVEVDRSEAMPYGMLKHVRACLTPQGAQQFAGFSLRFGYCLDAQPHLWRACVESFHWLPNVKQSERHVAADHVYRSPAAMLTAPGVPGIAVIPDLNLLASCRPVPQYLDMGIPGDAPAWIEIGFTAVRVDGHVYYERTGAPFDVPAEGIVMGAWVIEAPREHFPGVANAFLWETYGRRYESDDRPLVMPLERYAEYGYGTALKHLWRQAGGPTLGGITNVTLKGPDGRWSGRSYRDDLWFQCWFNNARTAWGLGLWGRRLAKADWQRAARQTMDLACSAPTEHGLFPAIYAPHDGGWKGSKEGENLYHVPDAAWTGLWVRRYNDEVEPLTSATSLLSGLTDGLLDLQRGDGAFPTWVERGTMRADSRLDGSASGALPVWFLGEEALRAKGPVGTRARCAEAVARGSAYLRRSVLPRLRFDDFELYYSCSGKQLDFYDKWTHSYGVNTLAVQWCAEAFRMAGLLGSTSWAGEWLKQDCEVNLAAGRFCVDLLCLFQQVWSPPYLSLYAFGGFGVMNTDGEWHDARQAQFAETLARWHAITGDMMLLERALAAARASLALMVCDEHRDVCPKNYRGTDFQFEVLGMMAENYGHGGVDERSYQSSFHWGSGSALATAAAFVRDYGSLSYPGRDTSR